MSRGQFDVFGNAVPSPRSDLSNVIGILPTQNGGTGRSSYPALPGVMVGGSGGITVESSTTGVLVGNVAGPTFTDDPVLGTISADILDAGAVYAGAVGVGTSSPASAFEINEPTAANISLYATARAGNSLQAQMQFRVKDSGGTNRGGAVGSNGASGGGLALAGVTSIAAPHVSVDPDGNVTMTGDLGVAGDLIVGGGGFLIVSANSQVISGGAVTTQSSWLIVDTEGLAATDNLDTINGGPAGSILYVRSTANARDITIRDAATGGGNIQLAGGVSFVLATVFDVLTLFRVNSTNWIEISRATN